MRVRSRARWFAVVGLVLPGCLAGLLPAPAARGEEIRTSVPVVGHPEAAPPAFEVGVRVRGAVLAGVAALSRPDPHLLLARAVEAEMVDAVDRVRGATVSVLHRRRSRGDGAGGSSAPLVVASVGSGVAVSHRGTWVLTNLHVVDGADALEVVTSDGRVHRARVKARVARYDLAVLAFHRVPEDLVPVPIPLAGERCAECGQLVLATGNPFFLANDGLSVATLGVVSGRARWMEGHLLHGRTIQHDAPVNPGNSGGPLWSLDGRLLGINETIATHSRSLGMGPCSTGASFSIAVDQVRRALSEMVDAAGERLAVWRGCRFTTARDRDGVAVGAEVGDPESKDREPLLARLALQRGDVVTAVTVLPRGPRARASTTAIATAADLAKALSASAGLRVRIDSRRGAVLRTWTGLLPKT